MYAASNYALMEHEDLDNVEDMRIHAVMYSNNATNLYKACSAGLRRQKYWLPKNKQDAEIFDAFFSLPLFI